MRSSFTFPLFLTGAILLTLGQLNAQNATEPSAPAPSPDGTDLSGTPEESVEPAPRTSRFRSSAKTRDERKGQFYIAGFGGISDGADVEDPELQLGPGAIVSNSQQLSFDGEGQEVVAGVKIGYETSGYAPEGVEWLVIRPALEIEVMYAPQSLEGSSQILNGAAVFGTATYSQDIDIFTVMLNPIARFQLFDIVTPYIGGGFGAALLEADAPTATVNGANLFGTGTDEEISLSLQAIAGIEVDIAYGISVFTEYKFNYIRDVSFSYGAIAPLASPSSELDYVDITRSMITGGLKYKF